MENSYSKQDNQLLEKVGIRIKDLRTKSGLSQEKLAFACDLDRTYIGSVERGERNISVINLNKIANALHVPPSELLNFEE
ncbi:MAG: helix-turn-helix domain-containing protein [Thermoanaerobaculia bacterium]|nr:helix-turn-helix domain-containing protein [Thermoanaerobaculia bacterium]